MGSMGEASVGAEGGFGHRGLLGPRGLSLVPLALLCLVFGAGGLQQPQGELQEDEVGFDGFEGVNEVGDYDEYEDEYVMEGEEVDEDYEVDYEYVDLQKDSDGDGLRDHINDPDDDNDGIPDLEDDDDDGDGVTDREDSDWFAHDEM